MANHGADARRIHELSRLDNVDHAPFLDAVIDPHDELLARGGGTGGVDQQERRLIRAGHVQHDRAGSAEMPRQVLIPIQWQLGGLGVAEGVPHVGIADADIDRGGGHAMAGGGVDPGGRQCAHRHE